MYNAEKHIIESLYHPGYVVFEGDNKNLIVYKESGKPNEKFSYKSSEHAWANDFTGNYISADAFKAGANVDTEAPNAETASQKWYTEYC
jgi:hypothetical protein